jgi:DNA (cytosine-5)-methyltransferase 1
VIAASLFSGIGAPETAMPAWDWRWCAEIEKFPSAVLAARHSHSRNIGDVIADDFTQRARAVAIPDVLVFGSPCQAFSVAGKRLGLDDARGNLALVALGIVARLAPRWFVFENVPGLLSSAEGRDFGLFLRAVDELGYSLAWAVLDAQHFGVAQRRQRVFAVGHSGDWRYPAAVLFEPESLCGDTPPSREARESVAGALGTIPPGGGWRCGADEAAAGQLVANAITGDSRHALPDQNRGTLIAHALNAKGGAGRIDGESETFVTHALRADGFDASEDGTGRGIPLIAIQDGRAMDKAQNGCGWNDDGSAYTIDGTGAQAIAFRTSGNCGVMEQGDRTAALNTATDPSQNIVQLGSAVRRLTPRECERLQGFPDDYTLIPYRGKPAADGPRYKALGNSMAVPVMRWILNRIEQLP